MSRCEYLRTLVGERVSRWEMSRCEYVHVNQGVMFDGRQVLDVALHARGKGDAATLLFKMLQPYSIGRCNPMHRRRWPRSIGNRHLTLAPNPNPSQVPAC